MGFFVKTCEGRMSDSRIYKLPKKNISGKSRIHSKYIEQNKSKLKYTPCFMQNGEHVTQTTDIAGKFDYYFTVTEFRYDN